MATEYVPMFPVMHPLIDSDNQGYWEGLRRHELLIQRCKNCGKWLHPPRPMCPRCLSTDMEWARSSGKGTIYSWVTVVYDKVGYPGIRVPYSVVLVELEEGIRLVSNVVDMTPEDIYIGMPVEVVFDDVAEDLTLAKFKKRES